LAQKSTWLSQRRMLEGLVYFNNWPGNWRLKHDPENDIIYVETTNGEVYYKIKKNIKRKLAAVFVPKASFLAGATIYSTMFDKAKIVYTHKETIKANTFFNLQMDSKKVLAVFITLLLSGIFIRKFIAPHYFKKYLK
jgi:hypothetical protein